MPKNVQGPDGKIIAFPDDMQEPDIDREMMRYYSQTRPDLVAPRAATQPNIQMQPATFAQDYSAYPPDALARNAATAPNGYGVSDADRGATAKDAGKELLLEGAQGVSGLAGGPMKIPLQSAILAASGAAQTKLEGGSNKEAALSGGIGAALPLASKLPSFLIKAFGADKARAAANFVEVMDKAKNVPIDTTAPGNTALKIQEFASRGGRQPKVVSDFLRRATDPSKGPITYQEGRDFASNAGQLSADERNALKPNVRRMIGQFSRDLGNANADAANQAGVLPQYQSAMREYSRAMTVEDLKNMLKGSAVNAAKYAVPTAIGGAAAGYVAKKALGLK